MLTNCCTRESVKCHKIVQKGNGGDGRRGVLPFSRLSWKTSGAKEEEAQRGSRGHKSAAGYTALAGPGAKGRAGAVTPDSSHPPTYTYLCTHNVYGHITEYNTTYDCIVMNRKIHVSFSK